MKIDITKIDLLILKNVLKNSIKGLEMIRDNPKSLQKDISIAENILPGIETVYNKIKNLY